MHLVNLLLFGLQTSLYRRIHFVLLTHFNLQVLEHIQLGFQSFGLCFEAHTRFTFNGFRISVCCMITIARGRLLSIYLLMVLVMIVFLLWALRHDHLRDRLQHFRWSNLSVQFVRIFILKQIIINLWKLKWKLSCVIPFARRQIYPSHSTLSYYSHS